MMSGNKQFTVSLALSNCHFALLLISECREFYDLNGFCRMNLQALRMFCFV